MQPWNVDAISFNDDTRLNKIRNSWLDNKWPDECSPCKKAENNNIVSRRQSINQWFTDNNINDYNLELNRLDYWCGNLCNLRCPTCNEDLSVAWQKELGIEKNVIVNDTWKQLDLSNIKWIHFNGGEPLLIDHLDFLKAIPNKSSVHLNYNTNGTQKAKKELIELWAEFKLVQIDFSIDGLNEKFEYLRYPAKWQTVKNNLIWYRETMPINVMFDINATISILNHQSIFETKKWFEQHFNSNRLGDHTSFRTQLAEGILQLNGNKKNALNYLNAIDSRRNTNWKTTFPELIDYFRDYTLE
jgi:organic radical activating enzyme